MEVRQCLKYGFRQGGKHRRWFPHEVQISQEQAVSVGLRRMVNGMLKPQAIYAVRCDIPVMEDARQMQAIALAIVRHVGSHPQDFLMAWAPAPDVAVASRPYASRVLAGQRYHRAGRFVDHLSLSSDLTLFSCHWSRPPSVVYPQTAGRWTCPRVVSTSTGSWLLARVRWLVWLGVGQLRFRFALGRQGKSCGGVDFGAELAG